MKFTTKMTQGLLLGALTALGCSDHADPVDPDDGQVQLGDKQVRYDVAGAGEPAIVFAHGAACNASVWQPQMDALAADHRVIALDLPGHGRSDAPEGSYPASLFADAVIAVMDDQQVERAVLVGHSFGVSVMRDVLLAEPERVVGMTMIDGFLQPLAPNEAVAQAMLSSFQNDFDAAANGFVDNFMFGSATPEPLKEQIRTMMLATPQHIWLAVLGIATDAAIQSDEVSEVKTVGVFTQNDYVPADYPNYLKARFNNLDYRSVDEGTGHFVMLEDPAAVTEAIADTAAE